MKALKRFLITIIVCVVAGAALHAGLMQMIERVDKTVGGEVFLLCGFPCLVWLGFICGREWTLSKYYRVRPVPRREEPLRKEFYSTIWR